MKVFEGTVTQTQFGQGFGAGFKSMPTQTAGFIQTQTQMNPQATDSDQKLVQVNAEHLKRLQLDPVAQFLQTVNKLAFIANLTPSLQKDDRVSTIESFYRANFACQQPGPAIKGEILKL